MKDNEAEIRGVSDSGVAVKDRIRDAASAYEIFGRLKREDDLASRYRAQIAGQINGNPPRDPGQMRMLGLGGFSNVNFREAEALIETNASSFWDLDMNVPQFIRVRVWDDRKLAIPDEIMYGDIIADEYTRTLKEWPGYFYNRMLSVLEMLKYGVGPVVWPDEWQWKFNALPMGSVLFPAETKALTREPELVMVRDSMMVGDLYMLIEDDDDKAAARDAGWNVSEVRDAILRAQKSRLPEEKRMGLVEWEAVQQQIKNNSFYANHVTCNPVNIVHIFIRDIDKGRKITHYIISEDESRDEFLYKKNGKFDSMYNMVNLFLAGVGDGYIRSVKGLGHKTYPHIAQSNRFLNHMVNSGYLGGSLIVSTQTPNAMSLTQFGPVTVIPSHAQPISQQFMPNLEQLAKVRMILSGVLNSNTGVLRRMGTEERGGPPKTAHEVQTEEIKNAKLDKTQINVHYLQLDCMHREIMRRLLNKDYPKYVDGYDEAKEFRRRCEARGVPKEFLDIDRLWVTAMRSVGYGSAVEQRQVSGELLGVSDRFPVIGQNNAVRDFVASRVGHDMVDRYVPVVTMRDVPNSETSVATLENNMFVLGMETLVGADQPHPIHVPIHMKLMQEMGDAYMRGRETGQVDVVKVYGVMTAGLQHIEHHLSFWGKSSIRKSEFKAFGDMLGQLATLVRSMEGEVRKVQQQRQLAMQQQAQRQQQGLPPDAQVKLEKVRLDHEIKKADKEVQNQIRREKAASSIEIANAKAAADIARKGMQ